MCNDYRKLKDLVEGNDIKVKISNGDDVNYINFDNAASTPPLKKVMQKISEFSKYYSSIHRGTGYKLVISTEIYEDARKIVASFINADLKENSIIFVKNSSEALNRLANCYCLDPEDIVIATQMEHHSNDLPWREKARVLYINTKPNGELNLEHYEKLLSTHGNKVKLVVVTGASNVTGYINPIHMMAKMAHAAGAKIQVDASQLIPHRKVDIKPNNHSEHIDFLVFSAHKMYAPFGTGVLVGPKVFFNNAKPDHVGGGTVKIVTAENVYWNDTPEKNEAGTPNVFGAVALASAIQALKNTDWDRLEEQENILTKYCLSNIKSINGVKIIGSDQFNPQQRLGVIGFNIDGIPHSLAAAILAYEYGIGVRNGCFCAHPYVLKLLNVDSGMVKKYTNRILCGDKSEIPGLVRISLGFYNTFTEVDRLIYALKNISAGKYNSNYIIDRSTGEYISPNVIYKYEEVFSYN